MLHEEKHTEQGCGVVVGGLRQVSVILPAQMLWLDLGFCHHALVANEETEEKCPFNMKQGARDKKQYSGLGMNIQKDHNAMMKDSN